MKFTTAYPTTEYTKSLLYKYIPKNKRDKRGLLLLPLQTGSGKTHATVQYMAEQIRSGIKENMIYIVDIKKSVGETYHKLLKELSYTEQNKVLWLKNNYETILDFFQSGIDFESLVYLNSFKEFKQLQEYVSFIDEQKSTNNDSINKETIGRLNSALQKALVKYYKRDKSDAFRREVALLYPSVLLKEYSAIFMTTKKFFFSMFDLEGHYAIHSSRKWERTTLFIDEFDTQKKVILSTIIEQENRYKYDIFDIVISIENALKKKNYAKKYNAAQTIIEDILKFYDKIFEKYNIARGFKYIFTENETRNTMLMDASGTTFINPRGKNIKVSCKTTQIVNSVCMDGEIDFVEILRDVTTALKMYIGVCKSIVVNEIASIHDMVLKEEVKEAIVHDLVKELGLSSGDNHYKYLSDTIANELFQTTKSILLGRQSLYESGFNIVDVKQKSSVSNTTDFSLVLLSNTPEKFLKRTCNNMFVVAISATATFETVIRNFDLEYLQTTLQENYKTLNEDEIIFMNKLYISAKKQEDREISIKYIQPTSDSYDIAKLYFQEDMNIYNEFLKPLQKRKSEYYFKQYERIVYCYMEFLLHDDIEAYMHLQSNFPKGGEDTTELFIYKEMIIIWIFEMMQHNRHKFSRTIQNKIARLLLKKEELKDKLFYKYLLEEHELIYFYNSKKDNQETYNKILKKKIENRDKIYLMSSYATIGTGVNMEYISRDGIKKDFDAIYMDNVTSLVSRFYDGGEEDSINNNKMTALYELESLYLKGVYSSVDYIRIAKNILNYSKETGMKYTSTNDYVNACVGMLIQAIGRLYRTDSTSKMYIYLSDDLKTVVSDFDSHTIALLPAVQQLIEKTKNAQTSDEIQTREEKNRERESKQNINIFEHKNHEIYKYIRYMLTVFNGTDIKESHTREWEERRYFLLSNPTVENDRGKYADMFGALLTSSKEEYSYYYSQEDDYKRIEIDFKNKTNKIEVSSHSAMLDVIANTKELEECVKIHNIALKFEYQHIMTPIVFNNLYKGAMGEILGNYIVEKFCDVVLLSLGVNSNEKYERFDYKTSSNIYIDFKYYSQSTLETKETEGIKNWSKEKMATMKGSRAIIINIFANSTDKRKYIDKNSDVVIVPFLIDIKDRKTPTLNYNALHIIKEICHEI